MQGPWKRLNSQQVDIVAPDGTVRCRVAAYHTGSSFIIDDVRNADMEPGDELRRLLPNGKEEVFVIDDPKLFDTGIMQTHYQVKVSRRGAFAPHTGGNYNVTISGPNARVNIHSTDQSTNIAHTGDVFGDMRQAVESGVADQQQKAAIIAAINEAEQAKDTPSFLEKYKALVGTAADHLGLLAPFLPALTALLG